MSILSYKQYKLLHENLDSVIGVSTPANIGIKNEAPQLYNMMSKMAKKMAGGPPNLKKPPMGDEDEDMGAPDMGGDMGMGAPDMGGDMGDEDEDMDDEDGEGDEDAAADMGDEDEDMDDDGEGDMGDDEDEEGLGDDDMGDDAGMGGMDMGMGMGAGGPPGMMGGPDMGMGGPPMKGKGKKPAPPMMMNKMGGMNYMKYMKKEAADAQDAKMKGQNRKNGACDQDDAGSGPASKKTTIKKEAADPQDAKMKGQNRKNGANDQNDAGAGPASKKTTTVRESKCCDKCGNMMSKKCNKMTKEQSEFNDSLQRQAGALKFQQDEYGYWVPVKEDVLIQQPQAQRQESEPQAGEVGFAPQAKVGILGSNFTEWASRHVAAVKKNKKK